MFRAGGQPKTGLRALTHVAWGTSLGGLVLIAEERRRRVALAQKIVENGKKLQAYKSYGGVAAIAEFDLGRQWEADLPHEEHLNGGSERSLTNYEWRTRRRVHKRLPNTTPELRDRHHDVSEHTAFQSHATIKKENGGLPVDSQYLSLDSLTGRGHRIRHSPLPSPSTSVAPSETPIATIEPAKGLPYTRQRSQLFQHIIAGRVQQCLLDEDARVRAAGYHELAVFFKRTHYDLGLHMRQAVQAACRMSQEEQEMHFTPGIRWNIRKSLQTVAPPTYTNVSKGGTSEARLESYDQSTAASRIIAELHNGHPDIAFFEFLALCERAIAPLTDQVRLAIKMLLESFQKDRLYSVVSDICLRSVRSLKDFELVRKRKDVLYWLLDGSTSKINLKFSKTILTSLMDISATKGIGDFSIIFLKWFSSHASLRDTMSLLTTLDDMQLGSRKKRLLKESAEDLTQRAFRCGNLDDAVDLMSFRARRYTGSLCTPGQLQLALVHLVDVERLDAAAELILAVERRTKSVLNVGEYLRLDSLAGNGFHKLNTLIQELHDRQGFSAVVNLARIVEDRSRLSADSQAYLYRAFAERGSITEVIQLLENLKQSVIRTSSEVVEASHGVLLRRCWKTTQNLELTEQVFEKIQALGPSSSQSHHFDDMIHACVEAHDMDRAQGYAARMLELNIAVTQRTVTCFMLADAIQGDWARVRELMQGLQQQASPDRDEVTARIFDHIYLKYIEQHRPAEVVAFVLEISDLFNVAPSTVMCSRTTDTIVKSEDSALLEQWFAFLEQKGQSPELSPEAISLMLHRISLRADLKFDAMLQTQKILDMVATVGEPADFTELLVQERQRARLNCPQAVIAPEHQRRSSTQQGMLRAMARKRAAEALDIYKASLMEGLSTEPVNLGLAVAASFQNDPHGYDEAQKLVEDARQAGLHVTRTDELFLAQSFKHRKLTFDEAHDIVFDHYRNLTKTHRKVSHYLAVAAARNLFLQGNDFAALHLLSMFRNKYRKLPIDMASMTLRLRIHIKRGYTFGVLSVVTQVLEKGMRIDSMFIRALQLGRQLYGDNAKQHWGPDMRSEEEKDAFRDILVECIVAAQAKRRLQRSQSMVFAQRVVKLLKQYRGVDR